MKILYSLSIPNNCRVDYSINGFDIDFHVSITIGILVKNWFGCNRTARDRIE